LVLPEEFEPFKQGVQDKIVYYAAKLPIRNKATEVIIKPNEDAFLLPEFAELWNRIKIRTTYRLDVDSDDLVKRAIESIDKMPTVTPLRIRGQRGAIAVDESGIEAQVTSESVIDVEITYEYPDPIRELQDRVELTRKTLKTILEGIDDKHYPGKPKDENDDATGFKAEPRTFLDQVATRINAVKNEMLADGVKYQKLPESEWYAQTVLRPDEWKGYLEQNAFKLEQGSEKYLYYYVVFDSATVEKPYAERLGLAEEVKVFAKLPDRFVIETPLGDYNPDWAYVSDREGQKTLYLVVETKGGKNGLPRLTPTEEAKISFATKHFEAIGFADLDYRVETEYRAV